MRAMTVVSRLASASFASTARVDRARRSQNFSFASIDAVRVERALATTCARRRVSRGRRDEDSTSAARPRRARVAGRRVFVSRRGFVTYTTRSNARVVSHENEQIRWAPRASVGRSVVPVVGRSRARAFVAVASAGVVEGDRGWRRRER